MAKLTVWRFRVRYTMETEVEVEAASAVAAEQEALREARGAGNAACVDCEVKKLDV